MDHPGSLVILLGVEKVRDELKLDSLQRALLDSLRGEIQVGGAEVDDPDAA